MTEAEEPLVTAAERKVGRLMSRPPFEQLVADTSGEVFIPKVDGERVVLNVSDLSVIAVVHNLRISVDTEVSVDASLTVVVNGWILQWKPGTPEKPWGVFA